MGRLEPVGNSWNVLVVPDSYFRREMEASFVETCHLARVLKAFHEFECWYTALRALGHLESP